MPRCTILESALGLVNYTEEELSDKCKKIENTNIWGQNRGTKIYENWRSEYVLFVSNVNNPKGFGDTENYPIMTTRLPK